MIKVLSIGQLPREVGGSYTTGVARVVHELSIQEYTDVEMHLYVTNMRDEDAARISTYPQQYIGYRLLVTRVIKNILCHPIKTIKEWIHYSNICHVNPLRFEIYKANYDKLIQEIHPDILHIHGNGISPLYFINTKYNLPILRTSHGVVLLREWGEKNRKACETALGTKDFADYDIALNIDSKNKLIELGVPEHQITIISNGVDSKKFYYSEEWRQSLRKKYHVKDETLVFMTVGVLIDRKGQLSFLKILKESGIDFQYWLFGEGPDRDALVKYLQENDLEERVRLFGQVCGEELYKYHSAADIYSHASTTEAQSLAEIEASSTGLRIVVNKKIANTVIGDAYKDVSHYYVLDFDFPDLERFCVWAKDNSEPRCTRSAFDWAHIANQYNELYKQIISKK